MAKIYILGLGPGDPELISLRAYRQLKKGLPTYLRTKEHGAVDLFYEEEITFTSFDYLYQEKETFEGVYEEIVHKLIEASKEQEVNYCVPGDPLVAERTVQLLMDQAEVEIISGISFIEPVLHEVGVDSVEGVKFLNGEGITYLDLDIHYHLLITQVYDRYLMGELKLMLGDLYGDDYLVDVVHHAGVVAKVKHERLPVKDLDRIDSIGHETTVFVPKVDQEVLPIYDYRDVWAIMDRLRGKDGCPWDREQDHESIANSMIEEAYEAVDAIITGDSDHLVEELGDVLLQTVFHAQIAYDQGEFYPIEVTTGLVEKLIYRHPHVFSKKKLAISRDVGYNWNELKYEQRNLEGILDRLYDVPKLPSLMAAKKIIHRVSEIGFTWPDVQGPLDKVQEELKELKEAITRGRQEDLELELGDVLFSLVNVAYFLGVDGDMALIKTNKKFIQRFEWMHHKAIEKGQILEELDIDDLEELWRGAKTYETSHILNKN